MKIFEFFEFLGRIAYEWDKYLQLETGQEIINKGNAQYEPLHFKIDRMMESMCNVIQAPYNSLYYT